MSALAVQNTFAPRKTRQPTTTHSFSATSRAQCSIAVPSGYGALSVRRPRSLRGNGPVSVGRGKYGPPFRTWRLSVHQNLEFFPAPQTEQAKQKSNIVMPTEHLAYTVSRDFATIPEMWSHLAEVHGDKTALVDLHHKPQMEMKFEDLNVAIEEIGAGLQAFGVSPGEKVSLFAENSWKWLVCDQGIMYNGATDAVRGSSTPIDELLYIIDQSDSSALIVEDEALLEKLTPGLLERSKDRPGLKFIMSMWGGVSEELQSRLPYKCITFAEVCEAGVKLRKEGGAKRHKNKLDDVATLVYTSGTTGRPKGVMLTHANLVYMTNNMNRCTEPQVGEVALSMLPPWHIYERSTSYFVLSNGTTQQYTNVLKLKQDLADETRSKTYLTAVPLVLDTLQRRVTATLAAAKGVKKFIANVLIAASTAYVSARRIAQGKDINYAVQPPSILKLLQAAFITVLLAPVYALANKLVLSKIRAKMGIEKGIICGGGSLANHLDLFFEMIGLEVYNGWGLSETSPVICCRTESNNVRGTVGTPMPATMVKVVDPETGLEREAGEIGLMLARGPGVMKGYYNNQEATDRAMRFGDGWFDTGDLGWLAPTDGRSGVGGNVILTGRAKDTIVLMNGENVEPEPIENDCTCSEYIAQTMVVGQDQRQLGALIVPNREHPEVAGLSKEEVENLITVELDSIMAARGNRPAHERIKHFALLDKPFTFEDGHLTRTMKMRRDVMHCMFEREIKQIYDSTR